MRQMVNGQEVEVPSNSNGTIDSNSLRVAAGVPENRPLILQMPDGRNQMVNPGEKLRINPGQYFMDAPVHRRGLS